jgi:hypothetical protein
LLQQCKVETAEATTKYLVDVADLTCLHEILSDGLMDRQQNERIQNEEKVAVFHLGMLFTQHFHHVNPFSISPSECQGKVLPSQQKYSKRFICQRNFMSSTH